MNSCFEKIIYKVLLFYVFLHGDVTVTFWLFVHEIKNNGN
jgi:hypothetical protein